MENNDKTENWFKSKTEQEISWLDNSFLEMYEKLSLLIKSSGLLEIIQGIILDSLIEDREKEYIKNRIIEELNIYKIGEEEKKDVLEKVFKLIEDFKNISLKKPATPSFIEQKLTNPIATKPEQGKFIEQKEGSIKKIDPYRETVEE